MGLKYFMDCLTLSPMDAYQGQPSFLFPELSGFCRISRPPPSNAVFMGEGVN